MLGGKTGLAEASYITGQTLGVDGGLVPSLWTDAGFNGSSGQPADHLLGAP